MRGKHDALPADLCFQAIWMMDPKDISEWQHEEFYRYIAQAYDKPRYTLHYKTDAPLNIRSLFYVPDTVSCCGRPMALGGTLVLSPRDVSSADVT